MSGRRVRGFFALAAMVLLGWWILEKRPTLSGIVDDLTRPLLGSRAAVKESEHNRIEGEASQVVSLGEEKAVGSVHEGMTAAEVLRLLGDPDRIEPVEDERGDRVRWIYRRVNRIVLLQRNRVVSVAIR
jgi:hypothetical protein